MQTATANDILAIQAADGSRTVSFTYKLLDDTNVILADITTLVQSCSVELNMLADINRTAKFVIKDDVSIDISSDRIQPFVSIAGADTEEWPLGIFLLSTAGKYTTTTGVVLRNVDGYDQGIVLKQDVDGGSLGTAGTRYTVTAGTRYTTAIKDLLDSYSGSGIGTNNVSDASTAVLITDKDWDPGTPCNKIIDDLLSAISYRSLYFDENGVAQAQPYVAPADRASEYSYSADRTSIMFNEANRMIDLFNIPNKWIRVVSAADRPTLSYTFINNDPTSPTSTVNRGRTIVDFATDSTAPDIASLTDQVNRIAVEASQVYETFEFDTAINPLHSFADVYTVTFPDLDMSSIKLGETKWSMDLKIGSRMKHSARRTVSLAQ